MIKVIVAILLVAVIMSGCTAPDDNFSITEGFGISADANVDNLRPGWSGTTVINVVNGHDKERTIVLSVRASWRPDKGYEALPEEYLSWFTIDTEPFDMARGEAREVIVSIDVPEDVDYAGKRAEVRIRATEVNQEGIVRIAAESKWYITTVK